jgi:hypothetical protein
VTLNWSGNTTNNSIQILRDGVLINTLPGTATNYVDATVSALTSYNYTITVTNNLGIASATANPSPVTTPMMPVTAPTIVSATPNNVGTSVVLRWTDNANNETAYWVDVTVNGVTTRTTIARSVAQGTQINGAMNTTIATLPGGIYALTVTAVNVTGGATSTSASATAVVDLTIPVLAAPATLTPGVQTATRAPFTWTAVSGPTTAPATAVSYVVQVNTNGAMDAGGALLWVSLAPTNGTTASPTIAADNTYQFRVVPRATRFGVTVVGTPSTPLTVTTAPLVSTVPVATAGAVGSKQIMLTWGNTSVNSIPTSFTVDRRVGGVWVPITPAFDAALVATATPGTYSWTDTGLAAGAYRYRVLATKGTWSSAYTATSNTVTAP